MIKQNYKKGFMALMSAIIISFILIVLVVTIGFSGFFNRFNVLDSESKERSENLAEACVDQAILDTGNGINNPRNVTVDSDQCVIIQEISGSPLITQACFNKAVTNLRVTIDSDLNVTNWEELPTGNPISC